MKILNDELSSIYGEMLESSSLAGIRISIHRPRLFVTGLSSNFSVIALRGDFQIVLIGKSLIRLL